MAATTALPTQPHRILGGDPAIFPELAGLRRRFIDPFVGPATVALELGPGDGLWTPSLLGAARVYACAARAEVFHGLLERVGPRANVCFGDAVGESLPGIPAGSVDFAFSFGAFLRLPPSLVDGWVGALRGILAPGGQVVFLYADAERSHVLPGANFSPTTASAVHALLARLGLEVEDEDRQTLPQANLVRARTAL